MLLLSSIDYSQIWCFCICAERDPAHGDMWTIAERSICDDRDIQKSTALLQTKWSLPFTERKITAKIRFREKWHETEETRQSWRSCQNSIESENVISPFSQFKGALICFCFTFCWQFFIQVLLDLDTDTLMHGCMMLMITCEYNICICVILFHIVHEFAILL